MTGSVSPIVCDGCGRVVHAIPETRYSTGWVHTGTNSELCDRANCPRPSNLARPPLPPGAHR